MRPTSFPADVRKAAKEKRLAMVRIQWDRRHVGGEGVEVVGLAPAWVIEMIEGLLRSWRGVEPKDNEVH